MRTVKVHIVTTSIEVLVGNYVEMIRYYGHRPVPFSKINGADYYINLTVSDQALIRTRLPVELVVTPDGREEFLAIDHLVYDLVEGKVRKKYAEAHKALSIQKNKEVQAYQDRIQRFLDRSLWRRLVCAWKKEI